MRIQPVFMTLFVAMAIDLQKEYNRPVIDWTMTAVSFFSVFLFAWLAIDNKPDK